MSSGIFLADFDGLYSMSPDGRCYNGYDMSEKEWREAGRCREALVRSVPAP